MTIRVTFDNFFCYAGRDASQSFITGDFSANNLSDDVSKLSGDELLSLEKWKEFYDKEYTKKGKLIGRYYDGHGNPTDYLKNVERTISDAKLKKTLEAELEKVFPPCNVEWDAERGTRVWCTKQRYIKNIFTTRILCIFYLQWWCTARLGRISC